VLWAAGLGLGSLGNTLLLLDVSAAERFSALLDGCVVSWMAAAFGYLCLIVSAQTTLWERSRAASRSLHLLALFSWSYHLLLLRWPWLTRQTMPGSRLDGYSGSLSRSWETLPVYAFGELLALALLFTHASLSLIAQARRRGLFPESTPSDFGPRVISLVAFALFSLSAWVTVSLTIGR
jgi:hypothetical protein